MHLTAPRSSGATLRRRRATMKTISLFLVLSVALFVSGCGGMVTGKKAAEQSVADCHKLYNDGKL